MKIYPSMGPQVGVSQNGRGVSKDPRMWMIIFGVIQGGSQFSKTPKKGLVLQLAQRGIMIACYFGVEPSEIAFCI